MPDTKWNDFFGVTELQTKIMHFVQDWVRSQKTPVPHAEILTYMEKEGTTRSTTKSAVLSLVKNNYLRRAIITSNKTYYVMLKTVK